MSGLISRRVGDGEGVWGADQIHWVERRAVVSRLNPMRTTRTRTTLLLTLALAIAPGCGSTYSSLKRQKDCPDLCALNEAHRGYGCDTVVVPTTGASPRPVGVAVHEVCEPCRDSTPGAVHDRTLVLIHGIFSDHECWRFVAGDLGKDFRLLLVDLPGCGESEAPDPDRCAPGDVYEPTAMARRTLQALRQRLTSAGAPGQDRHITIVAHSLGAMVTLRMFCDESVRSEFGDVLARVDGLVLIAPLDAAMEKADPLFVQAANLSELDVALGSPSGVVREYVAKSVVSSVERGSPALREEADKRLAILRDSSRRRAFQAMVRSAIPVLDPASQEFHPDWDRIDALVARYAGLNVRCLILWGAHDETLPLSMGYKLWAQIPTSDLRVFPACKHSPQIEQPAACAAIIREFLRADSTLARDRRVPPGGLVTPAQ